MFNVARLARVAHVVHLVHQKVGKEGSLRAWCRPSCDLPWRDTWSICTHVVPSLHSKLLFHVVSFCVQPGISAGKVVSSLDQITSFVRLNNQFYYIR